MFALCQLQSVKWGQIEKVAILIFLALTFYTKAW